MRKKILPALLVLLTISLYPPLIQAGPVEWREVHATEEGKQWWDVGSLHLNKEGQRIVLSRFIPTVADNEVPQPGSLFVMEIDCAQRLFRDTSVNGLPRPFARWELDGGDRLISGVIDDVCNINLS